MLVQAIAVFSLLTIAQSNPLLEGYGEGTGRYIGGGLGGGFGSSSGGYGREISIGGGYGGEISIGGGYGGYGGHKEVFVDYRAPPKYEYKYGVADYHTGDQKEKSESRVGDLTKTQYGWAEKDRKVQISKIIHGNVPVKIVGHY